MKDITRRSFVRLAGLAGLGAATLGRPPKALAEKLGRDLQIHRRTELMMGTYVTLTVIDPSLDKAAQATELALAEIRRLEGILTRYDGSAPLAHLARTGRLEGPAPELVAVLEAAGGFYRDTDGRFDITVAPVVDAQKESFEKNGRALSQEELARLLDRVDGRAVAVSPGRIELRKEGLALTLDGLGKGYIVDRAAETLKRAGIRQALLNAGGDIVALGGKGDQPWRVGVIDPTKAGGQGPVIQLRDRAIATSGNYEIFFDQDKLHHHIIDPKVGDSPKGPVSVSIQAADCLTADAMATALFCLSSREAVPFMVGHGAEGLIINRRGERLSRGVWG